MSEITEKKYLSYEGLTLYDSGIKEYVNAKFDELHPIAITGNWNDLIDRPFGIDVATNEILPQTTIAGISVSVNGSTLYEAPVSLAQALSGNKKYRIVFDGRIYDCIGVPPSGEIVYVGNSALAGTTISTEGNYPFCVIYSSSNPDYHTLWVEDADAHTVAIYEIVDEQIKQIDEMFIPDSIARVEDIPEMITEEIMFQLLVEGKVIDPVSDATNQIYTDNNGKVLCL